MPPAAVRSAAAGGCACSGRRGTDPGEAAHEQTPGTAEAKIKALYDCVMDTDVREKAGVAPIQKYLDAIENAATLNELAAADVTMQQELGLSIAHYDLRFLKPLDEEMLHEIGRRFRHIVTVEDGVVRGGMGSAVLEFMADHGYKPDVRRIGVPDRFIEHGTVAQLYHLCGMDEEGIYHQLSNINYPLQK